MEREAQAGVAAVIALAVLAGCLAPAGTADISSSPLAPYEPVRVLGISANEPAIAQHPEGALFVAAWDSSENLDDLTRPFLFRSLDEGATWARVEQGDGALGNSDADLAVAQDGTLYHAVMQYLPMGYAIAVGTSRDAGETWAWSIVDRGPFVDRPWVDVGPDGVAHVVWSGPRGLHHASSADGGATWEEGPIVHATGGSGSLAVGPEGELAVRVFPVRGPTYAFVTGAGVFVDPAADGVATSTDGGATWTFRELPGDRSYPDTFGQGGDGTPRWVDPVAFDAAGTLYAMWGENDQILLAASRDLGATWDVRTLSTAPSGRAFFPYLAAGAAGELVGTWFTGGDPLLAHVAHVQGAAGDGMAVREHAMEMDTGGSTAGEYFQATLLRDGDVAAALPVRGGSPEANGFAYLRFGT